MFTTTISQFVRQKPARRELRDGYIQRQILRRDLRFRKFDPKLGRLPAAPSTTADLASYIKKYRALDPRNKYGEWDEESPISRTDRSVPPRFTHLNQHGEVQMVKLPPPHPPSSPTQSTSCAGESIQRFKLATSRSATAQTTVVFSNLYTYYMVAHPLHALERSSARAGPTYDATGPNAEIDKFERKLRELVDDSSDGSIVLKTQEQGVEPKSDVEQQTERPRPPPNPVRSGLPNTRSKGDVLAVARIAGIQAAKATSTLIPLCHNIPLTGANVDISIIAPDFTASSNMVRNITKKYRYGALRVLASVHTYGQTGVEMEALVAASVAGMTVYDMCKAFDRGMQLTDTKVVEKTGGSSGNWRLSEDGALRQVDDRSDLGDVSRHTKYFSNDDK